MMRQETWYLFKSELIKQGFSPIRLDIRLDDKERNLRYSDDVFAVDIIDKWMKKRHPEMKLESIDHETMMWLTDVYMQMNVPTNDVDEDGEPDWTLETYDMWYERFEYKTLFDKYIDWKVRDELDLI